jgi:Cof subfamily protein (haloacid dehalogenase superfamily)
MDRTIKLVLSDIDGTLVTNNKSLTAASIEAVAALRQAGIAIAITSGRPPRGMATISQKLQLSTPIAGFNGGVLTSPDLASIIECHAFPANDIVKTLDLLAAHGLDIWVYTRQRWLVRDKSAPHVAHEATTVGFEPEITEDFMKHDLGHVIKIVGVSDDAPALQRAVLEAQSTLGDHVSASCSQPYYLDITNARANKGAVVDFLSRHLNIPHAQIATIGDSDNDMKMFARSGLSIAMGNASAHVQAAASCVTASNEENGFANAIHQFILGASP